MMTTQCVEVNQGGPVDSSGPSGAARKKIKGSNRNNVKELHESPNLQPELEYSDNQLALLQEELEKTKGELKYYKDECKQWRKLNPNLSPALQGHGNANEEEHVFSEMIEQRYQTSCKKKRKNQKRNSNEPYVPQLMTEVEYYERQSELAHDELKNLQQRVDDLQKEMMKCASKAETHRVQLNEEYEKRCAELEANLKDLHRVKAELEKETSRAEGLQNKNQELALIIQDVKHCMQQCSTLNTRLESVQHIEPVDRLQDDIRVNKRIKKIMEERKQTNKEMCKMFDKFKEYADECRRRLDESSNINNHNITGCSRSEMQLSNQTFNVADHRTMSFNISAQNFQLIDKGDKPNVCGLNETDFNSQQLCETHLGNEDTLPTLQ